VKLGAHFHAFVNAANKMEMRVNLTSRSL